MNSRDCHFLVRTVASRVCVGINSAEKSMLGRCVMRFVGTVPRVQFVAFFAGLVLAGHPALGEGPAAVTQRWAVLAEGVHADALADLVTAELSGLDHIQLVEREEIRRVMDELELNASGLVRKDRATRFGHLIGAEALVIIDSPDESDRRKRESRLRLVDTRTSVRLLDVLLPVASFDEEVDAIRDELLAASETLALPSDQLQMISVVPVVSGEPGELLKPYCQTLTALIAVGFHRRAEFVVLERSDLIRLAAESDLSGIELKMRGATRLLETSVRRSADGTGIIAACKLTSPGGRTPITSTVTIPSREAIDARPPIFDWILTRNGKSVGTFVSMSPEQEAELFDRRARWLRGEDSVAMAEAALALAPTQTRLRNAAGVSKRLAYEKQIAKQTFEALIADRRWAELRLRYLRSYPPEIEKRTLFPIYLSYAKPPSAETQRERILLREISTLRRRILEREYEYASGDPLTRIDTLLQMIDLELRWSLQTPDAADRIGKLLTEAFRLREQAKIPRDPGDPYYNELVRMLVVAIDRVHNASQQSSQSNRLGSADFDAWVTRLIPLAEPYVRAAMLRAAISHAGTSVPDRRGIRSARELVELMDRIALVDTKYVDLPLRTAALSTIPPGELFDYLVRMLDRSEQYANPTEVLVFGTEIKTFLDRLGEDQATEIARRMIRVLKMEHEANTMFTTTQMLVTLSRYVPRSESPFLVPPEFSLAEAPGPWQQYRVIPIRLEVDEHRRLHNFAVDHNGESGDQSLVLAWSLPDDMTSIERVEKSGGTPSKFGKPFSGFRRYRPIQLAVGNDEIFLSGRESTLTMVSRDAVRRLSENDGLASNEVTRIAWSRNRLYIGYPAGLGSYDPRRDRFDLYASLSSVRARNPLDAQGSFRVRQILGDTRDGCIWVTIRDHDKSDSRTGLWRCEPLKNEFRKLVDSAADASMADDGILVHRNADDKLAWVNRETLEVTELPHFSHASAPATYPHPYFVSPYARTYELNDPTPQPHLIKMGEHLIGSNATLYTSDGAEYPLKNMRPWYRLQRFENGFIAFYDSPRRTLWYVEPKP